MNRYEAEFEERELDAYIDGLDIAKDSHYERDIDDYDYSDFAAADNFNYYFLGGGR